jgi:hypothetical protein
MKGGTQPRGGLATTETSLDDKPVSGPGKIFAKKKRRREDERETGLQAAHDSLVAEYRCGDLADRFGRESAKKTGDDILEVPYRYERITEEFFATGFILLRDYKTDTALKEFLAGQFAAWIKDYAKHRCRSRFSHYKLKVNGPVEGHYVTGEMMTLLAVEYLRDLKGLIRFLEAVLRRWRKIFERRSLWRLRILTLKLAEDCGHDRKRILSQLQMAGEIANDLTPENQRAWLSKIGQICSRYRRLAVAKREALLLPVTKIA